MCVFCLEKQTRHGVERGAWKGTGSQEEGVGAVLIRGLRTLGLAPGLEACVVRMVSVGLCPPGPTLYTLPALWPFGLSRQLRSAEPLPGVPSTPPPRRPGLVRAAHSHRPRAASLPVVSLDPALALLDRPLFCPHSH